MNPEESKTCPYCCEEIKIEARKYKHCYSYLDEKSTLIADKESQGARGASPVNRGVQQDKDTGVDALIGTGKSMMVCRCLMTLFITLPLLFLLFLGGC